MVRRAQPAFHPAARQSVLDLGPELLALRRGPRNGQTIWALHNVTDRPVSVDPLLLWVDDGAILRDILTGQEVDQLSPLRLSPYGVCWLATGPT
jgi:sucrose phosphorylase